MSEPLVSFTGKNVSVHGKTEPWDLGWIFLVLFVFNINVSFAHIFPALRPLRLQLVFAAGAVCFFLLRQLSGQGRSNWSAPVIWYVIYCGVAWLSLEQAAAVGLTDLGIDIVSTITKQAIILVVIAHYASTEVGFRRVFFSFMVSLAVYQLHSVKALIFGGALVDGRFESYLGQTMNSDDIGIFCVMV